MAIDSAVASGAASGIDETVVRAAYSDVARSMVYIRDEPAQLGKDEWPPRLEYWVYNNSLPIGHGETKELAWASARKYKHVVEFERTHNPSLQSPEAPIRTGLEGEQAHDLSLDVNQLPSVVAVQSIPHPFSRREHYLRCNTCGLIESAPCHAPESAVPANFADGFDGVERHLFFKAGKKGFATDDREGISPYVIATEFDRLLSAHRNLQREQALAASAPEGKEELLDAEQVLSEVDKMCEGRTPNLAPYMREHYKKNLYMPHAVLNDLNIEPHPMWRRKKAGTR